MSVPATDPSLISLEKLFIGSILNSTVLFTFLMGIYTTVYFGTLTLYLTRKGSQRRMVILSITLLYLLDIIMLGALWYYLEWVFLVNGETRESAFDSISTTPGWVGLLVSMASSFTVVIADGLLACLCLAETVISGELVVDVAQTNAELKAAVTIQSALFFTSLASSLLSTLLIAFRIHSFSKQNGRSKRRFSHIIEIVVQSAAVYSLALLIVGVANALPGSSPAIVKFGDYGIAVASAITGIAPTVMVARVCLAADTSTNVSSIHNFSGLQFQGRSTQQNATQIMVENAPEMNVEVMSSDKVTSVV
ncbi:hypothetical protein GALMADRAFT_144025 [Galerina marginata CBS 339.88]|uniref:Uncharacterized protein n=1 Tax=Galerina marginata (strain CBS 339.88) TaxID=685588 RepID=A0A067SKA8_GALM3|nr:hypothetical protein GALMADRAFT_144025 [Galerina marginata CBS 339.88]